LSDKQGAFAQSKPSQNRAEKSITNTSTFNIERIRMEQEPCGHIVNLLRRKGSKEKKGEDAEIAAQEEADRVAEEEAQADIKAAQQAARKKANDEANAAVAETLKQQNLASQKQRARQRKAAIQKAKTKERKARRRAANSSERARVTDENAEIARLAAESKELDEAEAAILLEIARNAQLAADIAAADADSVLVESTLASSTVDKSEAQDAEESNNGLTSLSVTSDAFDPAGTASTETLNDTSEGIPTTSKISTAQDDTGNAPRSTNTIIIAASLVVFVIIILVVVAIYKRRKPRKEVDPYEIPVKLNSRFSITMPKAPKRPVLPSMKLKKHRFFAMSVPKSKQQDEQYSYVSMDSPITPNFQAFPAMTIDRIYENPPVNSSASESSFPVLSSETHSSVVNSPVATIMSWSDLNMTTRDRGDASGRVSKGASFTWSQV
jgi:hypothetical protein